MERSFKSNLSNCQVVVRFKRIELHKFKFRLQKNNNRSTYERHRKMSNSGPTHTFQTEFVDGSGRVLVDPIEHGEVPTRKKRNGEALADDFAERRRSLPAPPPPPPLPPTSVVVASTAVRAALSRTTGTAQSTSPRSLPASTCARGVSKVSLESVIVCLFICFLKSSREKKLPELCVSVRPDREKLCWFFF